MGSTRPRRRTPGDASLWLWAVAAFVAGNALTVQMVSLSKATSRVEVVERPGPVADPTAIERASRFRQAVPFLVLNATIAGGVALAFVAGRLEERRRNRLGLPPGLDERRVQAPTRLPRRPIAGRRTPGYSWLDHRHRFDITRSDQDPSRPLRHP